jgi:hypothetical protein
LTTADAAEEALIGRTRQIGQVGLSGWAEREAARLAEEPPPGARRGAKKVRWLSTFRWVEVFEQT